MLRAVLDANVMISALIQPKGASGQILASLLEESSFELIVSPAIPAEVRRSLSYKGRQSFLDKLHLWGDHGPQSLLDGCY